MYMFVYRLVVNDCVLISCSHRDLEVNVFPVGSMVVKINPICECDCDDKVSHMT